MSDLPAFASVRPSRGWEWLVASHRMFARARMYWLLLIMGYWMLTIMLSIVPVIGVIAATLLKPIFAVGFLAAAWSQERGERPMLQRLFAGFRSNVRALIPLGIFYAIGVTLALMASSVMDGGVLMRWFLLGDPPTGDNPFQIPGIQSAMILALICLIPTFLALWFAPALIVFQDQPTLSALAQSFRASIANFSAIIVYGVSVFLFWVVIPGLIISTSAVLFGQSGVLLGVALSTPFTLSVVAIIFIADYVVYRDLFHHHEALGSRGPATRS